MEWGLFYPILQPQKQKSSCHLPSEEGELYVQSPAYLYELMQSEGSVKL